MSLLDQNWGGIGSTDDEALDNDHPGRQILTSRDGTLMLIECAKEMFEPLSNTMKSNSTINENENNDDDDDNNELKTGFQLVMRACQRFYQSKIVSNDKDLSGIILYGTEKNKNSFDFNNIYILHDLAQPSAERIIQLENLSNKETYKKTYEDLFGLTPSKGYSLNEALWTCSNIFSNSLQRLTIKRIFIFTCNDRPHALNIILERQAKQRAKDLYDVGIQVEIFPILTETITKFDYKKFFQDILMLSDDELDLKNNQISTGRLNELLKLVYSKEHKKRAYCTVPFSLGNSSDGTQLQFSVSVFNMVRPCPKPTKIKLDMKTNMETKLVTKHYLPETAEILMPSDIQYGIDVSNRRVLFDADEIKAIKKFGDPGFQILGFKNLSCLLPHHYVKPGHFIYPDEKYIEGSSCLFNALLKKCLEKKMFILCQFIARRNTPPRLVALIPQAEEINKKDPNDRLASNGFHVYYLPYADDIRTLPKNDTARLDDDNVDLFKNVVRNLKFKYRPEKFENPALQTLWRNIEATALNKNKPEEFIDLTIPNIENQNKKVAEYIDEIKQTIFPPDYIMGVAKRSATKRKADAATTSVSSKRTKSDDDIDVEAAAHNNLLTKLTIPILKNYWFCSCVYSIMSHNIKSSIESANIAEHGPPASIGEHPNAITNRFYTYERIQEIVAFIQKLAPTKPELAIICGSGLGGLAELIVEKIVIPYADIPHFPKSTVAGHRSNLVLGILNGVYVVCMQGRLHSYEGYTTATCAFPVRVMHMLGAHSLIVTCAAGGINDDYNVGDIMLIKDHLNFPNLAGNNPLIGHNDERFGPRFPPVGHAYDREYLLEMKKIANKNNLQLREGVYCGLGGPCYETIAEINMLKLLGGDAVGMSTVHEVTFAAHCGMHTLGMALITNIGLSDYNITHEVGHDDVIRISELKANDLQQLVFNFADVIKKKSSSKK
ncbi:unnamed protein product [Rotaria sordida]|uniref:Purine nucleoside phosphorylase n=1 Tax=Rotaria sordida TaxID=392033 RepID=A0A814L9F9_9BILA|nr:unnamed protein product [Rotaria sordida]